MLKTIPLHNGKTLCPVKVPEGSTNHTIIFSAPYWSIRYDLPKESDNYQHSGGFCLFYNDFGGKKHYPEKLSILALANELNDEQKKEVCEMSVYYDPYAQPYGIEAYKNYQGEEWVWNLDESYASFLSANKLTNELLLIKDI